MARVQRHWQVFTRAQGQPRYRLDVRAVFQLQLEILGENGQAENCFCHAELLSLFINTLLTGELNLSVRSP